LYCGKRRKKHFFSVKSLVLHWWAGLDVSATRWSNSLKDCDGVAGVDCAADPLDW
jgi:hypothetical protein